MNFVNKLENKFEKYFDGIFPKTSSNNSKLQEIAAELSTRMEEESMSKDGFTYVPNNYDVYINLKKYRKLKAATQNNLHGYFENYLAKEANFKKYIFTGGLSVRFISDRTITTQDVKIMTGFTHEKDGSSEDTATKEADRQEETKVFEKLDITLPHSVKSFQLVATITVIAGSDVGTKIEFADTRVNIGRRPLGEMVLNDKSASRLHAYIVNEEGGHVLYDAQSLNGTYVNGEHILQKKLTDGDEIKIGDTIILYNTSPSSK